MEQAIRQARNEIAVEIYFLIRQNSNKYPPA